MPTGNDGSSHKIRTPESCCLLNVAYFNFPVVYSRRFSTGEFVEFFFSQTSNHFALDFPSSLNVAICAATLSRLKAMISMTACKAAAVRKPYCSMQFVNIHE